MKPSDDFRKQIRAYLKKRKMKAYKLAERAGIPQACIYEFLREKQGLNTGTMDKLKAAMR